MSRKEGNTFRSNSCWRASAAYACVWKMRKVTGYFVSEFWAIVSRFRFRISARVILYFFLLYSSLPCLELPVKNWVRPIFISAESEPEKRLEMMHRKRDRLEGPRHLVSWAAPVKSTGCLPTAFFFRPLRTWIWIVRRSTWSIGRSNRSEIDIKWGIFLSPSDEYLLVIWFFFVHSLS